MYPAVDIGFTSDIIQMRAHAYLDTKAMPKMHPLTFAEIDAKIAYDAIEGRLTWKVDISKNIKAGTDAGCFKGVRTNRKTGKETRYLYVRMHNLETPAARVAWLLYYGEWPARNVLFKDSDPANIRIANLEQAKFDVEYAEKGGLKTRKMPKYQQRHYGLRRYYGLTIHEYGEKLLEQDGKCAICEQPEKGMLHGQIKALSVDHNHKTGAIRGLLCSACNHMLGHADENRDVLLSAVKYLDKHAGRVTPPPNLEIVKDTA